MEDLKKEKVWINRTGKNEKIPCNEKGEPIEITDKNNYRTFEETSSKLKRGIALYDGILGIDIDGNKETGERHELEGEILKMFSHTYAENSPSGAGVHILFKVSPYDIHPEYLEKRFFQKNNGIECYFNSLQQPTRYFTYTGNMLESHPDEIQTVEYDDFLYFLEKYMQKDIKVNADLVAEMEEVSPNEINVDERLKMALNNKKSGEKFKKLFNKDAEFVKEKYKNDDSSYDFALTENLLFWMSGNKEKTLEALNKSKAKREKWNSKRGGVTWIEYTIDNARKYMTDFYKKPKQREEKSNGKREYLTHIEIENHLSSLGLELKFNEITRKTEFFGADEVSKRLHDKSLRRETIQNNIATEIMESLRPVFKGCTLDNIERMLGRIADKNAYNPVLEYLQENKYDKKNHLEELYQAMKIPQDDKLSRLLVLKWFWQGLALLHNNGDGEISPDGVLVLVGPGGTGKTTFFRKAALKNKWFQEGARLTEDKDTERRAITSWVTELGEVDSTFKRSDAGKLKSFITNCTDKYRLPYARYDEEVPRKTSLGATCNENQYLVDPTGNRRYWTVPIKQRCDIEKLNNEIDWCQIWLEVWEKYAKEDFQGYRLTAEEIEKLNKRNASSEKGVAFQEEIQDTIDHRESVLCWVTATEYMTAWSEEVPILRHKTIKQLKPAFTKLGLEQKRKIFDGKKIRVYPLPIKEGLLHQLKLTSRKLTPEEINNNNLNNFIDTDFEELERTFPIR